MLRIRPRRSGRDVRRHPATGWLFLAGLYLTATAINVSLAISMSVLWPILLAAFLAMVAGACVLAAVADWRREVITPDDDIA